MDGLPKRRRNDRQSGWNRYDITYHLDQVAKAFFNKYLTCNNPLPMMNVTRFLSVIMASLLMMQKFFVTGAHLGRNKSDCPFIERRYAVII